MEEIEYSDTMTEFFNSHKADTVFVNLGTNSDSGLTTMIPEEKWYSESGAKTENVTMHNVLSESRVYKNDDEMEIMRWASKITCEAHCNVMRNVKPGMREC
jgi:Xaa-Pro dipeptidase